MLESVLEWLKNWFEVSRFEGDFSIKGGELTPPYDGFLQNGQYFRINGSVFNDGLHQWRTKATGKNGKMLTVFDVFAEKLAPYRKSGGNYAFARPNQHMTPPLPQMYNWWR